jgi:ribonuclease HII
MIRAKKIEKIRIIGIDEAGRGPLAGPVAVGAVCFLDKKCSKIFKDVKESKQLSARQREEWFEKIKKETEKGTIAYSVSLQSAQLIDTRGLSFVIKKAINECLESLNQKPQNVTVLLDGGLKAPILYKRQKTIIKGDTKEPSIALASIIAKVTRDRLMIRIAKKYPVYGFEIHKGYGTKLHRLAVMEFGPAFIHRKSFLKNIVK